MEDKNLQISAIIMAGGKGTRFNFEKIKSKHQEKLLLKVENKFIIEHVISAVSTSEKINRVILAVSPHSINTKAIISTKYESIEIIDTPGKDFHADLGYIFRKLNLNTALIISGDLPLIQPEDINEIILKFIGLKKPALSVMAKAFFFKKYGLSPTTTIFNKNFQEELVPLGINIINGNYIYQSEIDQAILIREDPRFFFNINTTKDFEQLMFYINQGHFFDD